MGKRVGLIFFLIISMTFLWSASVQAKSRIIGGSVVEHSQYPYMVSFVNRGDPMAYWGHFCGGTLIAPRWVLTAAHCMTGVNARNTDVVIGRSNLRSFAGERIAVARAWKHPFYTYTQQKLVNDIALVYLRKRSRFGKPASISDVPDAATVLHIAGWGMSRYNRLSVLQAATILRLSDSDCQDKLGNSFDQLLEFCVGSFDGQPTTDICMGDSGGPAIHNGKVVGVVSYTRMCRGLSGFASAAPALDWIRKRMANPPAIRRGRAYQAGKEYRVPNPGPYASSVFISSTLMYDRPGYYWQRFSFETSLPSTSFQIRMISGSSEICVHQGAGSDPLYKCYAPGQYFPISSWAGNIFWEGGGYSTARCPVYQYRFTSKGKTIRGQYEPCRPHAGW